MHVIRQLSFLSAIGLVVLTSLADGKGLVRDNGAEPARIAVFSHYIRRMAQERGLSLKDAAERLRELGVRGFDASWKDPRLDELVATALVPVNLYGHVGFLSSDGGKGDMDALIGKARSLGFPRVMVIPDSFTSEAESEDQFRRMVDGLRKLVARGAEAGIAVTIEDYGGDPTNPCNRMKYLKRFLAEVPGLRLTLDSGNLQYARRAEDILELMRFARDRIEHVHLKDQLVQDERAVAELGTGCVPNGEIVNSLSASGYAGWYTLESCLADGDVRFEVVRQVAVLREWLGGCRPAPLQKLDVQGMIGRARPGGRVRIPSGRWEVKPFCLKSGITLELPADAILFASTNLADYAAQEGERTFVSATDAENVTICGKGILDGRGYAFRETAAWRMTGASQPQALPVMMRFTRCRNLKLEDFTYRRGGAWGCHLRNCDGVEIRRLTCFNHVNNTNDGIDIESRNVLIEDCLIDADDDAIVLKTESDRSFEVTNVVVRNCRLASDCNAFKFGTGSYCAFRNVTVENCTFFRPQGNFRFNRGALTDIPGVFTGLAGLALEVVDGGCMEDVVIRNITIEGYLTPVFVRLGSRTAPPAGRETYLRNILIENVRGTCESRIASSITGVPGLRPSDITLRNCDFTFPGGGTAEDAARPVPEKAGDYPDCHMFDKKNLPAWAFYVRHADRVVFENVNCRRLAEDAREKFVFDDADVQVR